jgi:hypothetical protein
LYLLLSELYLLTDDRTVYPVDCYENRAAEVGTVVNMGRQLLSFYVTFYIHQYTDAVGYAWAYGIFAILSIIFFLPVVGLMVWGGKIRRKIGVPGSKAETVAAAPLSGDGRESE